MKNTEDILIIHPDNLQGSALRFSKKDMDGCILDPRNPNLININIIDYNRRQFDNEVYFLFPDKSVKTKTNWLLVEYTILERRSIKIIFLLLNHLIHYLNFLS